MATSGALEKLYIRDQGPLYIRPSPGQLWTEGNYEAQDPAGMVTEIGWPSACAEGQQRSLQTVFPSQLETRMPLILYPR